jgi:two-component system response regulator HydG
MPPLKDESRRGATATSRHLRLLTTGAEPEALAAVERIARNLGFDVVSHPDTDALEEIRRVCPDAVFIDVGQGGPDVFPLVRAIRDVEPSCAVILAGQTNADATLEAVKLGALDFLSCPLDADRLRGVLTTVVKNTERREALFRQDARAARQFDFHGIVGRSAPMQDLFDSVRRIAPHARALLIAGEPGTGKELVAQAVHRIGPRRDRRFVTVSCSSSDADALLESDLFGHERGAFPGAIETRIGAFEQANGGTLFLDEVAAVPLAVQDRLLRAIERGETQRMGAADVRYFDVYVLATTSRNLAAEVAAGRFRRDLFDRLNVLRLDVPPVRERRDDVPLLVASLLQEWATSMRRQVSGVTTAAERALQQAAWTGNVPELKAVLERASSMSDARLLGEREVFAAIAAVSGGAVQAKKADAGEIDETDLLSSAQRRQIERVLKRVGGNKTEAARLLGVSRRALYRWLERLELTPRKPADRT